MKLGRNQFEVVMRKRYFRPEELVDILNKNKAEGISMNQYCLYLLTKNDSAYVG